MSRRFAAVLTAALLAISLAPRLPADDWPTYRNDAALSGASAERLTFPLQPAWTHAAASDPETAWAGPNDRVFEGHHLRHRVDYDQAFQTAIADGRVFYGSSVDHHVRCVDLKTGREIWRFATGAAVRLAPTVWQDRVLFGSDDGCAYCVDRESGELKWKLRAGPRDERVLGRGALMSRWPVRTNVLVDDGVAYFGAGLFPHEDVYLYAVDAATGEIVWKRDTISESDAGRDDLSPQGYLLANEDTLFVPSGRSLPAAVDRKTGEVLHKSSVSWRAEGVVGGTRALLAGGQLYSHGEHVIIALDQETGRAGHASFDARQMAVAGEHAYLADGNRLTKVHLEQAAAASRQEKKIKEQLAALAEKLRGNGDLKAIREQIAALQKEVSALESAGVLWRVPCAAESSLIVTGSHILAGGNGQVEAFDAGDGKRVWSQKVAGDAHGLAVADGHLIVSTDTGRIDCFGPTERPADEPKPVAGGNRGFPEDERTEFYQSAAHGILLGPGAGPKMGFCLLVGAESGRLAAELARQSDMKIYGIEPDAKKVETARRALMELGLYGHRVTIEQGELTDLPYPSYFANIIASETQLLTGTMPGDPEEIARHLKPCGGVVVLGSPRQSATAKTVSEWEEWLDGMGLADQSAVLTERLPDGTWTTLTRGELPGAGDWSHQYAGPGNTASTEDQRVKGGLGVLWFGDPGPGEMVNRHDGAVGPLAVAGRLIVQGHESIMAYDAYNGVKLWEQANPEAYRTGVFQNYSPGNLVASDDDVFVMVRDEVHQFNAATGGFLRTHLLPEGKRKTHEWGYIAYQDGLLFGTATVREELEDRQRRRGRRFNDATDTLFAIDVETGDLAWTYQGKSISHHTVAVGPNRIYFIDSTLTAAQREELLREDKTALANLTGEEAKRAEERMKRLDLRLAVALDARTGQKQWEQPVDVTDCSDVGTGGGKLTLMHQNGVLVLCGANANGHYWKQFLSGEFSTRRLVCLSAEDGHKLWGKDANYRHRPIVIGDEIIAEPWAFDLYTGAQKTRPHPLTGEPVPWSIIRPGHHCGMLTGCPNMLMFRSGYTGFYDLDADDGTRHFAGHRLGCWINAIPANGLVMIPEASAGCVCQFSIASTIVLEPREARRPWTIASAVGAKTPVQRMALNLGAPGDRKDARGQLWLAYPRPNPRKETGLDLTLDLQPVFAKAGGYKSVNAQSVNVNVPAAEAEWLYTSWADGLRKCTLPLLGKDDAPATYTVRLHFADLDPNAKPGRRVFDIRLQGQTVLEDFDPAASRGAATVREFNDVRVTDNLTIELVSGTDEPQVSAFPLLNAIEVVRQEHQATR